jgi:transposase
VININSTTRSPVGLFNFGEGIGLRNKVERLIGRIKEFRRIATRYEKRAHNYAAMLTIAAISLWSQGFAYTP